MKRVLCALVATLLAAACQWLPVDGQAPASSDTASVAVAVALDSIQVEPASPLDSVPADTLAALLEGIRRLSAEVTGLSAAADSSQQARPAVEFDFPWLRFIAALAVLALAWFGIRLVAYTMEAVAERAAARPVMVKRLIPVVRIVTWGVTFFVVLKWILGVDAQGLLAAGAAAGVAVGFAAQDILKNIFGGIIVILDQPFQVGDKVRVGGTYGEVISIGLRSTKMVTPDDNLVTVPNAQIVDGQVANANAGERYCQVVTELYLPGWVDEGQAKALARDAAVSSEFIYLNKPVVVLVRDTFKETFLLQVVIKAYVLDPALEFQFMSDVTERARSAFREAGMFAEDRRFGDMEEPMGSPGLAEEREL